MKAELRATIFLETLDPNTTMNIVQQLVAGYSNRWARPIKKQSFSNEIYGSWSDTLEDFNLRIKAALTDRKVAYGTCQCQWRIQDAVGDQYWWIRAHLYPIPNLRINADDLEGDIGEEGLRLQEAALISLANDGAVNLAETKSEYIGRLPMIYLYFKLVNCGMIVPSIHVKRKVVEPEAVEIAFKSLLALLVRRDIDNVQAIQYVNILESVRLIDDVVKANLNICKIWIESLGCKIEEWLR